MPTLLTMCGSLRADSWNHRVMTAAASLLPEGWTARQASLREVPLFDQDLEDAGSPEAVTELRAAVIAADAVLCATPQYNHGISGVLKNALDWLSRPAFAGVLAGKPAAALAVTTGRHQPNEALAQTETTLEVCVATVIRPGVAVASIGHILDDDGALPQVLLDELGSVVASLCAAADRGPSHEGAA